MNFKTNYGGDLNYVGSKLRPTAFKGAGETNGVANGSVVEANGAKSIPKEEDKFSTTPATFTSEVTDDDFVQPRALWEVFGRQEGCQERFVDTVAEHVSQVKRDWRSLHVLFTLCVYILHFVYLGPTVFLFFFPFMVLFCSVEMPALTRWWVFFTGLFERVDSKLGKRISETTEHLEWATEGHGRGC